MYDRSDKKFRWKKRKNWLPNYLQEDEWEKELLYFNNKCALTGSSDVTRDHFIPISTGHAGTYLGNVFPLDRKLNCEKNNMNTLKWAKLLIKQGLINELKWKDLLSLKARQNNMSVKEFTSFVNWCHTNPRNFDDISSLSEISSIEMWRKCNKRHNCEFAA